jgi:AGZA family xanthine/uracil permease-like MFS transporter
MLALGGLVLIVWLMQKKSPLAFLAAIFAITLVAFATGRAKPPTDLVAAPDFGAVLWKMDLWGALAPALAPAIVSILFTDLFDSISTFVGVSHACGLVDERGEPKNVRQGLIVDSIATFGAGILGTSSGTAYIESASGIEMGGRTGLTSVFAALCFLPCLFLAPLAGSVPPYATAPVLILVGALMFKSVAGLTVERLEDAVPVFLTLVLIPLTFSITQGILWGFVSHVTLYVLAGRRREIALGLWGVAALSAGLLVLESLT